MKYESLNPDNNSSQRREALTQSIAIKEGFKYSQPLLIQSRGRSFPLCQSPKSDVTSLHPSPADVFIPPRHLAPCLPRFLYFQEAGFTLVLGLYVASA